MQVQAWHTRSCNEDTRSDDVENVHDCIWDRHVLPAHCVYAHRGAPRRNTWRAGLGSKVESHHAMPPLPVAHTDITHSVFPSHQATQWERLDDDELDVYFQADEANGIRNRSCGPERTSNGTIRWISGMATTVPGRI